MTAGAAEAGAPPQRPAPRGPAVPFDPSLVETTIPEAFAHRTAPHRARLALRMGPRALSYAELGQAAARIAAALSAAVPPGPGRVVLLLDDRVRQVLSILGALEAGLTFVPLDPSQPAARLAACLASARPCAVLAEPGTRALAVELAGGLPVLDAAALERAAPGAARPAPPARAHAPGPRDPACILFTSGSTGRPKGVVQTHRTVLHNVAKLTRTQRLSPDDRVSLLGNVAFAASMSDLFGALLNGASLHPYDVRRQGVEGLAGWLEAEGISVCASVPTLFRHATASLEDGGHFPRLRLLKLAGEPVQRRDVERFRRCVRPPTLFLNSLGATEINTIRQHFLDHETPLDGPLVPVGYAVEDTDVLILDASGRPLPAGETGEIAVRSEFLSPGYWDEPQETARAFVADPEGSSRRVFRTGDLGRLRPDGCLEHLGRGDGQVRVRGHRVETAEIEAALLARGDLVAAAVVGHEGAGGDVELVAWLVSRPAHPPGPAELRASLAATLPDYMLPARYTFRAALPLLATGKVDRRALAALPAPAAGGGTTRAAPSDPLQQQLLAIWERVLRVPALGVDDDFFALGGHSLLAARIVSRIHRQLGVVLPLTVFREAPTVAALAARLARGGEQRLGPLVVIQEGGALPPFYCVPGAGSDAFSLLDLARAMGPEQPLIALQIPGLYPDERPPESVEAIAALFVERLRARQPHGPYALGGSSFGGVVAFAMAQALHAAGQEVAPLALFDTLAPGYPRRRPGLRPGDWPRLAARWVMARGSKEQTGFRALKRGLREKAERARFLLRRALRPGAPPPPAWRFAWLRELLFRAQDRYRPAPYPGAVTIFRHERQPPADLYETSEDLGWGALVGGPLELHDVPGLHGDALRPPSVALVARLLGDALGSRAAPTGSAAAPARGAPRPRP